ncbi:MAG: DUF305 domain-containing protein [Halobacteriovoraceae bacterium]|nr:DUF305 domain-containing protein [Halobacteriovoraceae bacterium]|tara:strand:- start:16960 stop:17499 length:540 start_codon:yes stop_codon:yes gene_type:complete
MNNYLKLGLIVLSSMFVMYGVTYLSSVDMTHVYWSESRLYMTLIMGAALTAILLGLMRNAFYHKLANKVIYATSAVVFVLSLTLIRSQITVGDHGWMSAMIPHHSTSILQSKNADIEDVRVKRLAQQIVKNQEREIQIMKWLMNDIDKNGRVKNSEFLLGRTLPDFDEFKDSDETEYSE